MAVTEDVEKRRARDAARYRRNREAILAYARMNKDVFKPRQQAWRAANKDVKRVYDAAYYATNCDTIKVRTKAHQKTERGRLTSVACGGKRRALKRGTSVGKIDWPQVWSTFDGNCGICKQPLQRGVDKVHIDHIVALANGGAHVTANLQVAHATCNQHKGMN